MASSGTPANGISSILFVIQRNGPNGPGSDRVPASLTCFRQPLLPEYSTRKRRKKKKKLELALESGKGFDVPLGVVFCFFSFPPLHWGGDVVAWEWRALAIVDIELFLIS